MSTQRRGMIVLAGMWITAGLALASAPPSVEEIMGKCHEDKVGIRFKIGDELQKASPDWTTVQKQTKDYSTLVADLSKNEAPAGDAKSWEKLTKEFAVQIKSLDEAAGKKDGKSALEVFRKSGTACKVCHNAHRE